ncbi:unnamed protein product [Peronospora belbahrii]|nr:unnamed protein product [Peronospora belbahrii]
MRSSLYYEISLHIKGHKSVKDCMKSYLAAEVLDGENKYFCEHCNTKQCAERFLELKPRALPQTLMVQLMRFVYDVNAGRKKKLTDVIEINETLNMTELLRCCGHAEAFDESEDVVYRLQGYLNHRGKSAHVGHYTASIALPKSQMSCSGDDTEVVWFEFDDAIVSDMAKSEATKEYSHGKKIICSRDIYMLMYVRDDKASDESTSNTMFNRYDSATEVPLPSKMCREEVEARNRAFKIEVDEYVSKANGMKVRIQERLDAYEHFFEKNHPYPDSSASHFYWVDTEWLRCWVTGEEHDRFSMPSHSSHVTGEAFATKPLPNVPNSNAGERLGDQRYDDDNYVTVDSTDVDVVCVKAKDVTDEGEDPTALNGCAADDMLSRAHYKDGNAKMVGEMMSSVSPLSLPPGAGAAIDTNAIELHDAAIPFTKPIDVTPFRCAHSSDFDAKACDVKELRQPTLRFAPENAIRLKRISAELFAYFRESCVESQVGSWSSVSSAQMKVFESPTYRCTICEKDFCNKLLNDANRLKEVNYELGLLMGSPASVAAVVAAGKYYLMSRAWIKSYKNHLQMLHKELSHVADTSKKERKLFTSMKLNDVSASSRDGNFNGNDSTSARDDALQVWQRPINEDITCLHGNRTLEKRTYRPVSAETWSYFSAKFPYRAKYAGSATDPCSQCESDEMASKACIQIERNMRDDILSDAALESLYRRKPKRDSMRLSDVFELPAAQRGSGLEKTSWSEPDATQISRRMFLVSRRWLAQWRAYIRNVEEDSPLSLTMSSLLCTHQKLVLPSGLLAAQQGQVVDTSSLEVEFVSLDEMQALAERYGDPDMPFYYGLLAATVLSGSAEEGLQVMWRKCSLSSLKYGNERVVNSKDCTDGVVPLAYQDTNDEIVICAECQANLDQKHRDELENFSNRMINIRQLQNDDQLVQITSERMAFDATIPGRRRSRRSRPGSAYTWPVLANATDTVYILKAKIYEEFDALPIRQGLYFKGEVLDNHSTLKQCGIKAGDIVYMRLSEDSADDLVMDESLEREVGFIDSVFHSSTDAMKISTIAPPDTSGDEALALAMVNNQDTQVWVCPVCTFVNDDTYCEMCSTSKDDDDDGRHCRSNS